MPNFSLKQSLLLGCFYLLILTGTCFAQTFDVLVYGGTVSGIAAALNAAERGHSVALVEPTARIGGLVTGGLSYTDFRSLEALGGTFLDYTHRVEQYYRDKYGADSPQVKDCYFGTLAEPHVSLLVLQQMLAEQPRIKIFLNHRLASVALGNPRDGNIVIRAARFHAQQQPVELSAHVFIDATYEGDLAAFAGAPYRVGRESTREYGERLAGVLYFDGGKILPGSTGEGDSRVQCYNFRVPMTSRPELRVLIDKPANYRREAYTKLLPLFRSGQLPRVFTEKHDGVLRIQSIANGKADINDIKGTPVRFALPGENYDYPDGDEATRQRIIARHRDYTLGLFYFLQNDAEMPEGLRNEAREWGLCKDEFTENGNFPTQLYIREARRILGEYVFTEHDALMAAGSVRAPLHTDSIAIGDYVLNCHGEQPPGLLHPAIAEGDFAYQTVPFQIPYGVIVPRRMANLLVTVAVSASHIGYSALRLEPTYTAMGQAAGLAAHVALKAKVSVNKVSVEEIQNLLHDRGAMTIYFSDVPPTSPHFKAAQYFGTRGFFHHITDPRTITWQTPKLRFGLQYSVAMPHHEAQLDQTLDEALRSRWQKLMPLPDATKPQSRREWITMAYQVRRSGPK